LSRDRLFGSSKVITDDMAREIRDRLRAELERRKAALREAGVEI
jgi:hypothetical protein